MFILLLILSSFLSVLSSNYKELPKHSSVKVSPGTRVYFDLSPFKTGELISFEIILDLIFDKDEYKFQIGQISSNSPYDVSSWENLHTVINKNVSCDDFGDECTFTWDEVKQDGKNYIYIIPSKPSYSLWDGKIKIKHLGGLSAGAIVGIVFGCLAIFAIIITVISCCCCRLNPSCYGCCYRCCPSCACAGCACCHCCGRPLNARTNIQIQPPVVVPVTNAVYPPQYPMPYPSAEVVVSPQVYPQPIIQQPGAVYPAY